MIDSNSKVVSRDHFRFGMEGMKRGTDVVSKNETPGDDSRVAPRKESGGDQTNTKRSSTQGRLKYNLQIVSQSQLLIPHAVGIGIYDLLETDEKSSKDSALR